MTRCRNPAGGSLRRGSEASKDASIAESFRRVDLRGESDPGPTGGSTSAAHIKTTQAQAGLRAITAKDERTGLRTHWLLGEQGKYTDPKTSQTRSAMPKYVRRSVHEESRKGDASGKGWCSWTPSPSHLSDTLRRHGEPGERQGEVRCEFTSAGLRRL